MANKKQYKIIPIQHLLKGNKIAKAGDVVAGSQFINLQDSLDRGFCEEVKAKKEANTDDGGEDEIDLSKLTKDQLLDFAETNEIELSEETKKAKKADIIDVIIEKI